MNINPGGMLDLYGLGGGTLELGGDFNNAEDAAHFEETLSTVVFNGSTDQTITSAAWNEAFYNFCLLYTSPSPRDRTRSRMPSSA